VLCAVIGAVTQPTAAKAADVFGRVELIVASVFFYVGGTLVQATAHSVAAYAAGTALYQVGLTTAALLVEIIIADITSTRSRLVFSYIPAVPCLITTWVSGNVAKAVLEVTSWRRGIGMWAVLYPVCALPLPITLLVVSKRTRSWGFIGDYRLSFQKLDSSSLCQLFRRLDVAGIVLLVAVASLLLVPLTIAGGLTSAWHTHEVIVPLVVGALLAPVLVFWEMNATHPLLPFKLMKDRAVWGPIGIAILLNFAWTMQGDYLYTVMIVAFDFGVTDASRIISLYSFAGVIVGPVLGLVVFHVRRLKIFILVGTALFTVAFGLLIYYRGSTHEGNGRAGVIAAQAFLGIAGGLFAYPAQASLQVHLGHEDLAVMTGVYLSMYHIGSALGNAMSGLIWTHTLPRALSSRFSDPDLVATVFDDPLVVLPEFPMGTSERQAIIEAYRSTQRLLTTIGICLCVPLIGCAAALRNPVLNDEQTLANGKRSITDASQGTTSSTSPEQA
jgi:MFS transporter, SIT family, siderophore-iron:H+ symporter